MRTIFAKICKVSNGLTHFLDGAASVFVLIIRLYLAKIFIWSAWLKITSWSSTLYLFQYEYKIVGMSPVLAAYLGTAAEFGLPILLVLGIGGRLPALALFIFNVFTVVFYPALLTPEAACQLKDSILWGVLILILIFYGHGKISLDYWLQKKVCPEYKY